MPDIEGFQEEINNALIKTLSSNNVHVPRFILSNLHKRFLMKCISIVDRNLMEMNV